AQYASITPDFEKNLLGGIMCKILINQLSLSPASLQTIWSFIFAKWHLLQFLIVDVISQRTILLSLTWLNPIYLLSTHELRGTPHFLFALKLEPRDLSSEASNVTASRNHGGDSVSM
ncbi:hypothetical protein MPER_08441, partial [Moniliophthora perniciosa FA553]